MTTMEEINLLKKQFEQNTNSERAQIMSAYMKGLFPFYGIMAGPRKLLVKDWMAAHNLKSDLTKSKTIIHLLFLETERELQYAGIDLLLALPKKQIEKSDLALIKHLIVTKPWWDTVDLIASNYLGEYLTKFPEEKYKVIAVDCRNYGKSIDKGDSLSDEMIADDISELLIKMNINSVYVLGLSSGANSALWLAAKYPNQVIKAVINGANLTSSAETIGEYWNLHHKNILDSINSIQNKTEKDKIELKIIKREYNNMTLEDLHKIQAPSLIISGDYDTIKPSHSLQIFENIKKSYLYIQPSSGHLISWIYKDEFLISSLLFPF